jgi:sugar-specific transcriptional regulator TrmB
MDLSKVGLSKKEEKFYKELLEHGPQTVRMLSERMDEQRTNCYLILDSLVELGLVKRDDLQSVTRFCATHPRSLQKLVLDKQKNLRETSQSIAQSIPELTSLYRLSTEKNGIAYFEGLKGYIAVHDDMYHTEELLIFISHTIFQRQPEIYDMVQKKIRGRGKNGVRSRFIACAATKPDLQAVNLNHPNTEVRATEAAIFDGEISIYDNKVVLTTYEKNKLKTLVITDPAQAQTFRAIFELVWSAAE